MSDLSHTHDNPLNHAEAQLREICKSHARLDDAIDAGALNRMLVHIRNINASVCSSTRDHVNAAKRLSDFAATLGRMAGKSTSIDADLAARIGNVAATLRDAGADIADGTAMPRWAAPAGSAPSPTA
jgi:hypothetical protein